MAAPALPTKMLLQIYANNIYTVEKSRTNAAYVTLLPLGQAILGDI